MGRTGPKLSTKDRSERDKKIVDDYLSGMNRMELVEKHGYHKTTISRILKEAGIKQRSKGNNGTKQDKVDKLMEEALKAPEPPKLEKIISNGQKYNDITYRVSGW